jgi:hypothetical protein
LKHVLAVVLVGLNLEPKAVAVAVLAHEPLHRLQLFLGMSLSLSVLVVGRTPTAGLPLSVLFFLLLVASIPLERLIMMVGHQAMAMLVVQVGPTKQVVAAAELTA